MSGGGGVITSFAKENILAMYGGEHQTVRLSPKKQFECSFYATFDDMRELGLCAATVDDLDGVIHVSVQGESVTYETDFPIANFQNYHYDRNYVVWKLQPGTEYHMSISVKGNKSGVDLMVTNDGYMPLNEYRNSSLDGVALGEIQPLGSIVYNETVRSRMARLYLTFLVGCYLWVFGEVLLYGARWLRRAYRKNMRRADNGSRTAWFLRFFQ